MDRRHFFTRAGAAAAAVTVLPRLVTAKPERPPTAQAPQNPVDRKISLKGLPEPYPTPRRILSGLEAYTPRAEKPWDYQRANYLLRRTMFGAKRSDIEMALTKTPSEVVDMLLADTPLPSEISPWVNENWQTNTGDNGALDRTRIQELSYWWIGLMVNQDFSIREKMTLFWHDHWATEATVVRSPQFSYWFNDLHRRNYLGNFKQMVKDVTVSPAMLVYLDGHYNTKFRPNENYARELMELHTLGEGIGYTEEDIQNASRALTGWTLSQVSAGTYLPKDATFVQNRFDATNKTIMGQTGNWNSFDVVDIIFTQHSNEVAQFICRKLYREFVYEVVDETIVGQMVSLLIASNWELKPVVEALLKSEHFFDSINYGSHITSPIELYIGAIRSLEIDTTNYAYIFQVCSLLGMQLFEAPNVKGWPGYRWWISASLLAYRWAVTDELINGTMRTTPKFKADVLAYAGEVSDPEDPRILVDEVLKHLLVMSLSTGQFDVQLGTLLLATPEYEWNLKWQTPGSAVDNVKNFLIKTLRLGETQII